MMGLLVRKHEKPMISTYFFYAALGLSAILFYVLVRALDPTSVIHKTLFAGGLQSSSTVQSGGPAVPESPALERAQRLVEPYVLVRARYGLMLANENDLFLGQAIVTYGDCCEDELDVLLKLCAVTSGTMIEVGSNAGTHTLPLAKALGESGRGIVAFEPQPFVFQNMCATLSLNAIENVRAFPFAAGEENSVVYFDKPDYLATGNFGAVGMGPKSGAMQVAVPSVRLDDFVDNDPIGLMTVDVEGAELAVLKGAENLIVAQRPVMYVKNDRSDKSKDLIEWLWAHGYELWWHAAPLYNGKNFFNESRNLYPNVGTFGMVCVHKDSEVSPGDFLAPGSIDPVTDSGVHPRGA
jgi:FkbM family methyltransferase